jgi:hypothetical protein
MFGSGLNASSLDIFRKNKGNDKLKRYFLRLVINDRNKATRLINDENLQFGTLYVLLPLIKKYGSILKLNERNACALEAVDIITGRKSSKISLLEKNNKQLLHKTLVWILGTGYADDGLNDRYDEIIDSTGILLVKRYKDKSLLNLMIDIVFNRNRRDAYIHDLLWSIFETRDPQVLVMISRYLDSGNTKDSELAHKLLWFVPSKDGKRSAAIPKSHGAVTGWVQDNMPFLEYTGESFQQTPNPAPFTVSLIRKYLCKPAQGPDYEGKTRAQDDFNRLDPITQEQLANYSYWLYRKNWNLWDRWMHLPVGDQVRIAKSGGLL